MAISGIYSFFNKIGPQGLTLLDPADFTTLLGFLFGSKAGITAVVGGNQATGAQLIYGNNQIETSTPSGTDAAVLPAAVPGITIEVNNATANAVLMLGVASNPLNNGLGDTISANNSSVQQPTATGVSHSANTECSYMCFKSGTWKQMKSA